jgi:hypothetical protein
VKVPKWLALRSTPHWSDDMSAACAIIIPRVTGSQRRNARNAHGSLALATKVRSARFQLRAASLLAVMNVPAPGDPVP